MADQETRKLRTHTLSVRCTTWAKVLRRLVPRRREQRRGNRMSMRPCGMSAHDSGVCVSNCSFGQLINEVPAVTINGVPPQEN